MSQENVALVQRFEQLMSAHETHDDASGNYGPVLELVDPDVLIRVPAGVPHAGTWKGHQGLIDMANKLVSSREVVDFETEYIDGGEHVVVLTSLSHKLNGEVVGPFRMVIIYHTRAGKITGMDPFFEDTSFFD